MLRSFRLVSRRACSTTSHIFVWDVESTGFSRYNDQIIELAVYHPSSGESFNRLVKPTKAVMSEGAEGVHGISMAMLQEEEEFGNVWKDFLQWSKKCHSSDSVLMLSYYSGSLDIPMTKVELGRTSHRALPPSWIFGDAATAIRSRAKHETNPPPPPSWKLQVACPHYGIEMPTHRALDDTLALWKLIRVFYPTETDLVALSKIFKKKADAKKPSKEKTPAKKKTGGGYGAWWMHKNKKQQVKNV